MSLFGQWVESNVKEYADAIAQIDKNAQKNMAISYETSYSFYKDIKDTKASLQYNGKYIKKNNLINTNLFGKILIQDEEIQVTIDSVERVIIINKIDSSYFSNRSLKELENLVNSKCKVEKKTDLNGTSFSIQFTGKEKYSGLEINFDKQIIKEMILYSKEQEVELEDGKTQISTPKLIIRFYNYKYNLAIDEKEFIKTTAVLKKENNTYRLNESYSKYKLIDLRRDEK